MVMAELATAPGQASPPHSSNGRLLQIQSLRRRDCTALDDPKMLNVLIIKREHYVAGFGETHVFVELVIAVVPIALGRPKIAAAYLVLRGLVLVNPPI
jgi:hypothetical protein